MTALDTTSVFDFWRGCDVTEAEGAYLPCDPEETGDYGDPPYTGDGDEPDAMPAPPTLARSNVAVALTAARPQAGQGVGNVAPVPAPRTSNYRLAGC